MSLPPSAVSLHACAYRDRRGWRSWRLAAHDSLLLLLLLPSLPPPLSLSLPEKTPRHTREFIFCAYSSTPVSLSSAPTVVLPRLFYELKPPHHSTDCCTNAGRR